MEDLDYKTIQVICIEGLEYKDPIWTFHWEEGKLYYGREYNSGPIYVFHNNIYYIKFPDGEKSDIFQKHFKFFTV